MRHYAQISQSNLAYAERENALRFVERCAAQGPQMVYEPSAAWKSATIALAKGWVYAETDPNTGATYYRSNLSADEAMRLRTSDKAAA